jgi:hypothetical protein
MADIILTIRSGVKPGDGIVLPTATAVERIQVRKPHFHQRSIGGDRYEGAD